MVLVDTTIFINHFRGYVDPVFEQVLTGGQIYLSRYVRIELLQGVRKTELSTLEYFLAGLKPLPKSTDVFDEAERILSKARAKGLTFGAVDLLIAAESNIHRCPLYSLDGIFDQLAKQGLVSIL